MCLGNFLEPFKYIKAHFRPLQKIKQMITLHTTIRYRRSDQYLKIINIFFKLKIKLKLLMGDYRKTQLLRVYF